ncbi:MAG: ATP-binding protein [Phycisphaerales bacterium]|nr:MAG: ATP-binding protein [Phycisphaerales bacterium]
MTTTATEISPQTLLTREQELVSILGAYNEVTEKLRLSHEQLQQEVRKLRDELTDKSARLARSERLAALGQMAAGLAHEIRNPLGGIQLFASLLEKDLGHMPEQHALVQKISSGVCVLDGLVSDILNCAGEMELQFAEVDLVRLVHEAVELLTPLINQRRSEIVTDLPDTARLVVDGNQVRSALLNLLRNAVEAAGQQGRIFILLNSRDDREAAQISIADNGPGIPEENLDKIFNPFFTTKDTGTGLGLAQVHRIIEAHGGCIRAENLAAGGARFCIELPGQSCADGGVRADSMEEALR